MKKHLYLALIFLFPILLFGQNVGIGTMNPDSTAILDVNSTTRGFLPPRMTQEQRKMIISPAAGLIIYCTDCKALQQYDGNNWTDILNTPSSLVFWSLRQGDDLDGETTFDQSGSVCLSADGKTLAIGANGNDGGGVDAGHVRVYYWNGTTWIQQGDDIDSEAAGDQSGYFVSLSSNGATLAIGAPLNTGNNQGYGTGHVRVYHWNGVEWIQQGSDIDGEAAGDWAGFSGSLSADGSILAIGSPYSDGNGLDAGQVRTYYWNGTAWVQQGADIVGEVSGDNLGWSVSLSADGSTLAMGARYNDGNGADAGHVRVYFWNGAAWMLRGTDIDGEAAGDQSGYSVSLSVDGAALAIGARYNDGAGSDAGQVRVYRWSGMSWQLQGGDIDGEAPGDESGISVSLSTDGNTVAIGAVRNDGSGLDAGQVRVYYWNGMNWGQQGADIDGEAPVDYSGQIISLSSDGSTLAIGATGNDGNGSNSGHVRVYLKDSGTLLDSIEVYTAGPGIDITENVISAIADADTDPTNELQDWSNLPGIPLNIDIDATDDFDGDYNSLTNTPTNVSSFTNDSGYITTSDDADADPTNEIQTISRTGTTVTLSNAGGTFTDSVGVYTAGTGIDITENVISATTASWDLEGNAGTVDGTHFIGTTDDVPFTIRVNNEIAGRIDHVLANTFYGYHAGQITSGINNTAIGTDALLFNTVGDNNTAIGQHALYYNDGGGSNTSVGFQSLESNTTGSDNTASGVNALLSNSSGNANTANGQQALISNTTGNLNTANGQSALYNNLEGESNSGIGGGALFNNTTGNLNTALGAGADVSSGDLTNATAIGAGAIVDANNSIQLGDANVTSVRIGTASTATLVTGGMQLTGGAPGVGKVLTSDASGIASWTAPTNPVHFVGESYGGGVVFYVYDNGQHGLIAATTDQNTSIQWYNGTYRYTGGSGNGLKAGVMNTAIIVATQISDNQTGNFAAKVCANYSVNVGGVNYGDWYLPSTHEWNLLYLQGAVVGGFNTSANYWTSTETNDSLAALFAYSAGYAIAGSKNGASSVRAIRAF